jgi:hypothetical protein
MLKIEELCHCPITYEDPQWRLDDVKDVTLQMPSPPRRKVFSPRAVPFTFFIDPGPEDLPWEDVPATMQIVLQAFAKSGNPGQFEAAPGDNRYYHVRPYKMSLLDIHLSLPQTTSTAAETLNALVEALTKSSGVRVGMGTVPINFLAGRRVTLEARDEPALRILEKILTQTGSTLSWRLLHDFNAHLSVLNLHFVT